jgi:hypothetical protein
MLTESAVVTPLGLLVNIKGPTLVVYATNKEVDELRDN